MAVVVLAVPFLAVLENGGVFRVCIGADGHVGLQEDAASCACCCEAEARDAAQQEGLSPESIDRPAETDCCVHVSLPLAGQHGQLVATRAVRVPPPAAPDAHVGRAARAPDLLACADPWEPPWPAHPAASSLRTVVLLI